MPVHDRYSKTATAEEFAAKFAAEDALATLVAIPSNADIVAAEILCHRPRQVLLLMTRGISTSHTRELQAWLDAWPFSWPRPRLRILPRGVGPEELEQERLEAGLDYGAILPELEAAVTGDPRKVGYLITGGQSHHTTVLARHAQVAGSPLLHFQVEYRDGKPVPGTGRPDEVPAPETLLWREALVRARSLLRERAFDAAHETLEALTRRTPVDHGNLVAFTKKWVEANQARDAMLFGRAADIAGDIDRNIPALEHAVSTRPAHETLRQAAQRLRRLCLSVVEAASGEGRYEHDPRLPLLVEILARARQERQAMRWNHAALLYYRALEAIFSERLRVAYGVDVEQAVDGPEKRWPPRFPEAGQAPDGPASLARRFDEVASSLGLPYLDLGQPLAFMAQLCLLLALKDPALPDDHHEMAKATREFTANRNRGIFAHGFEPVSEDALSRVESIIGVEDTRTGFLNLMAPHGPSRGKLNLLRREHQGPYLDDDGVVLVLQ